MIALVKAKTVIKISIGLFRHSAMSVVKPENACSLSKDEENTV